jgi:hypothetical protein
MTIMSGNSSGRWRAGHTELDVTGLDWPQADATGLLEAIERAQLRGLHTPLTIHGVIVAWIVPPRELPPPIMAEVTADLDGQARSDGD